MSKAKNVYNEYSGGTYEGTIYGSSVTGFIPKGI